MAELSSQEGVVVSWDNFSFVRITFVYKCKERGEKIDKNMLINLKFFTKNTTVKQLKLKSRESCLLKINIPQAHKHQG